MANAVDLNDLLLEMQRTFNVSPIPSTSSTASAMSTVSTGAAAYTPSAASTTNPPPSSLSTQRPLPPFRPVPLSQTHTTGQPVPPPPLPDLIPPSMPLPPHNCPRSTKTCSLPSVLLSLDLLPLILSHLTASPRHLLSFRLVCRLWNEVIHSAPGLRTAFFALPMWKWPADEFLLLAPGLGVVGKGLNIRRGREVEKGCWLEVSMSKVAAGKIVGFTAVKRASTAGRTRRVGATQTEEGEHQGDSRMEVSRLESLFITQPPILCMQAFIEKAPSSCNPGGEDETNEDIDTGEGRDLQDSSAPVAKLSCDAGITLGFLAETTLSLLSGADGHRRVQSGGESSKSAIELEENNGRKVVFKAIVSFCAPRVAVRKRGVVRTVTSFE